MQNFSSFPKNLEQRDNHSAGVLRVIGPMTDPSKG
jgi:hypothetical protein